MSTSIEGVVDVLLEGRDFLANAISYYDAVSPELVHEGDREMVAALTQAVDLLTIAKGANE